MAQTKYKEIQQVLKQVAQRAMLDKGYRQLCLTDSKAAMQLMLNEYNLQVDLPDNIIFLEEDREDLDGDVTAYILPPFLKQTWLTGK